MKPDFYVLLLLSVSTWSAHIDYTYTASDTISGSFRISESRFFDEIISMILDVHSYYVGLTKQLF